VIRRLLSWLSGTKAAVVTPTPALYQPPRSCEAVQHSDQMMCRRCDLAWDVNDPSPPKCRRRRSDMRKVLGCAWPACGKGAECACAMQIVGALEGPKMVVLKDRRIPAPPPPPPTRTVWRP